jgi:hypothetical protein
VLNGAKQIQGRGKIMLQNVIPKGKNYFTSAVFNLTKKWMAVAPILHLGK